MKTRDEQAHEYAVAKLQEFKATSNGNSNARERLICFGTAGDAFLAGWDAALINQWRDAREELPEMRTRVLVMIQATGSGCERKVRIGKRIPHDTTNPVSDKWHWSNASDNEIVVLWMPIPDLP